MFPVTLKSSSGSNKNSQSAALCQWSEVPQHPGLVCCLTHTTSVPVVLMIKPHQILVQPKPSSVLINCFCCYQIYGASNLMIEWE